MRRMIGFDRKIQLDWLDVTVGLCQQGLGPNAITQHLKQNLESEIKGPESRRKTVTVLSRLWVSVPEKDKLLHAEGLQLAESVQPGERLWLHWGVSLLAYPFFRDVAAIVGQLGHLQGTFSLAQVRRRMVESWGERTTLQRAVPPLVRTLFEWGVILEAEGRHNYTVASPRRTENRELALWLLECALRAHGSEQVLLQELGRLPYTFSFDLLPFVNNMRHSARFEVTRQGLDLEMVALVPPTTSGQQRDLDQRGHGNE